MLTQKKQMTLKRKLIAHTEKNPFFFFIPHFCIFSYDAMPRWERSSRFWADSFATGDPSIHFKTRMRIRINEILSVRKYFSPSKINYEKCFGTAQNLKCTAVSIFVQRAGLPSSSFPATANVMHLFGTHIFQKKYFWKTLFMQEVFLQHHWPFCEIFSEEDARTLGKAFCIRIFWWRT